MGPKLGTRYGNRTRLTDVKGQCPKPIDEPCIINTFMSIQDYTDLVERLLKQIRTNRPFKDSHEQMLYERGYLTGLLARLAEEDSFIASKLIHRLKK